MGTILLGALFCAFLLHTHETQNTLRGTAVGLGPGPLQHGERSELTMTVRWMETTLQCRKGYNTSLNPQRVSGMSRLWNPFWKGPSNWSLKLLGVCEGTRIQSKQISKLCNIPNYTILYYTILYYTILYYTILYYATSSYAILANITLYRFRSGPITTSLSLSPKTNQPANPRPHAFGF